MTSPMDYGTTPNAAKHQFQSNYHHGDTQSEYRDTIFVIAITQSIVTFYILVFSIVSLLINKPTIIKTPTLLLSFSRSIPDIRPGLRHTESSFNNSIFIFLRNLIVLILQYQMLLPKRCSRFNNRLLFFSSKSS